jgi:DNA-repair protein complementing XP-A cells
LNSTAAEQNKSQGPQVQDGANVTISSRYVQIDENTKKRKLKLTEEQIQRIAKNREKALQIRQRLNGGDATPAPSSVIAPSNSVTNTTSSTVSDPLVDTIRLNKNNPHDSQYLESKKSRYQPPPIKRNDYIEYDFSTMVDSKGGYINDGNENELGDGENIDEWKEKQKQVIYEPAPPTDPRNAPKCFECGSIDIDLNLYENFRKIRVCRKCKKEHPEKYSLLTKTECREDYLLTEPELRDVALLPRIEKANPHGFSRMQLFLRLQVEEFAWKKWGGSEKLDDEWQRRETNKHKRKEKKYYKELLEMRKKTRAEEFTRKLRNGQSLGERHVHDWSVPLAIEGSNMVKKRCIDCGVEIEEMII